MATPKKAGAKKAASKKIDPVVHFEMPTDDRKRIAKFYNQAFAGNSKITTPFVAPANSHVYHQYTLKLEGVNRDGLRDYLEEKGIPSMLYYPVPVHRQKMFDSVDPGKTDLPVTDWLTERVISLPIHTELDEEQLQFITSKVIEFVNKA